MFICSGWNIATWLSIFYQYYSPGGHGLLYNRSIAALAAPIVLLFVEL